MEKVILLRNICLIKTFIYLFFWYPSPVFFGSSGIRGVIIEVQPNLFQPGWVARVLFHVATTKKKSTQQDSNRQCLAHGN